MSNLNAARRACAVLFLSTTMFAGLLTTHAQESPVVDHAKRVFQSLGEGKFEDVTKEFNGQMATLLSAAQLRDTWTTFTQQVGPFSAFIDQRVVTPATGVTAVILGCKFEKNDVNVVIAFDAEDKIGGLRFMPRTAP